MRLFAPSHLSVALMSAAMLAAAPMAAWAQQQQPVPQQQQQQNQALNQPNNQGINPVQNPNTMPPAAPPLLPPNTLQPVPSMPPAAPVQPMLNIRDLTEQAIANQNANPQPPLVPAPPQDQLTAQQPASAEAPAVDANAAPSTQDEQKPVTLGLGDDGKPVDAGAIPVNKIYPDTPDEPEAKTNQGIDMNLEPSLVADDGSSAAPEAQDFSALPYEEQLRIRTKEIQQQARSQAFEQSKKAALPLEPYEIRDLLRRLKDTQEAIQTPVRTPPKPKNVIKTISTDPAAKMEVINLAVGNVTALNIVDVTGAPWPIVDIAYGGNFDIKAPDPGGSIIRITPLRDFESGNLIIRLMRMTTPITFVLKAGGSTVNYRFDARIPEYGPSAKLPIIEEGNSTVAGDATVTSVLEGVPPAGAEKLKVDGVDARTSAYRIGGSLYVRTPLTLLSPAWRGSATSADGMNVYVLAEAPVLLMSDQGALVRAHLSAVSDTGK